MTLQKIQFPKILNPRGNLTFLEYPGQIPFEIKRVFWTYDIPGGETTKGSAFRQQQEVIISLSGSFDVVVTHADKTQERISLNRSYYGLYLPALTWRHLENFSTNSLVLHVSSMQPSDEDFIQNFNEFQKIINFQ